MGEVYKARDTRLNRHVALKVSRENFTEHFSREARAIAALNHPHICILLDVGENFLVMELVDGQPLKGPLPIAEVLRLGAQIAHALDAAHRLGIVHRDLKPANILVAKSGVKLLDFGVARVVNGDETITATGVIAGTPAYMAPEQRAGKRADHRMDIYALGCVLYEMLTGRRASAETRHAHVEPPGLSHIIRGCLAEDPEDRWQSARDIARNLESIHTSEPRLNTRARWPFAFAALLVIIAASVGGWHLRPMPAPPSYRLSIPPPPGGEFVSGAPEQGGSAISPDGRLLAFSAFVKGRIQLYVRPIDSGNPRPVPGTDGAAYPFWSPDSKTIGFYAGGKLKRVEAMGGPVRIICDSAGGRGASWNSDGVIIFAQMHSKTISRVAATGEGVTQLTQLDAANGETQHFWPQFLPDNRHFIYLGGGPLPANRAIYVASIDEPGKPGRRIVAADANAAFASNPDGSGFLLYTRERALYGGAFDLVSHTLTGNSEVIIDNTGHFGGGVAISDFSVSRTGIIAIGHGSLGDSNLVWRDRAGGVLGAPSFGANGFMPVISPSGTRIAFARTEPQSANTDIWTADSRGGLVRLTDIPSFEANPVWSHDGESVYFMSAPAGGIKRRNGNASGPVETVLSSGVIELPGNVSPDGQNLILRRVTGKTGADIFILPLHGSGEPYPFLETSYHDSYGQFSPDGRWVVYASDETGETHIYAQPFLPGQPASGKRIQISAAAGGGQPRWRRDGKELFYIAPDGKLMAVPIQSAKDFEPGTPVALYETNISPPLFLSWSYDTADGQRFLFTEAVPEFRSKPMTILINWQAMTALPK